MKERVNNLRRLMTARDTNMFGSIETETLYQFIHKHFPDMQVIYEDEGWTMYCETQSVCTIPKRIKQITYPEAVRELIVDMARILQASELDIVSELLEMQVANENLRVE